MDKDRPKVPAELNEERYMAFKFHLPSFEEMRASSDGLEMMEMIEDDSFRTALVTGCPGSGKTTISIYRIARRINQGVDARLLTHHKLLVCVIRNLADVESVKEARINTFYKWQYLLTKKYFKENGGYPSADEFRKRIEGTPFGGKEYGELIIDEGQDLPPVVFDVLPHYFNPVFVGADKGQKLHSDGADPEKIEELLRLKGLNFKHFHLGRNWRNTYETYAFARQFIDEANLAAWDQNILDCLLNAGRNGRKPRIFSYATEAERNATIKTIINNNDGSIGILCASKGEVDEIFATITAAGFVEVTKYHSEEDLPKKLERCIVTTYISAKGLEFDIVILPQINYPVGRNKTQIQSELYVACTRARGGLLVFRNAESSFSDPVKELCDPSTYVEEPTDQQTDDIF